MYLKEKISILNGNVTSHNVFKMNLLKNESNAHFPRTEDVVGKIKEICAKIKRDRGLIK